MLNFSYLNDIPETGVKIIFVALFLICITLVFLLPKNYVTKGIDNPKWYHNLKLWAAGVVAILSTLHIIF